MLINYYHYIKRNDSKNLTFLKTRQPKVKKKPINQTSLPI